MVLGKIRSFVNRLGTRLNPNDPIFPILTGDKKTKEYKFIGTGFFVNHFGGFITAKHVLFDNNGQHIKNFYAITSYKGNHYMRFLHGQAFAHPSADICYGILCKDAVLNDEAVFIDHSTPALHLLENEPNVGDTIQTFAYPKSNMETTNGEQLGNFVGEWFDGKILEILPYRDRVFFPSKVLSSDMPIYPGASGGPVMKGAFVVGINSSGYDFGGSEPPLSYITPISFAYDIEIEFEGKKIKLKDKQKRTIL
jgi:hypothetical protein